MLWRRAFLLSLLLVPGAGQAEEAPWQGALRDGSQISIDPLTNKATRSWQGESSQLWDGVHQLENGAVIIVRDGIVVKDQAVLQIQQEQQRRVAQEACLQLVRKVCGPSNECESHPACDPARQLLVMEQEEMYSSWSNVGLESSRQCLEALAHEGFFAACTKRRAGASQSPCTRLMQRVCGEGGQCGDSQACDAARQLLQMEREDRYASPNGSTYAGSQCSEHIADEGFFRACQ